MALLTVHDAKDRRICPDSEGRNCGGKMAEGVRTEHGNAKTFGDLRYFITGAVVLLAVLAR